METNSDKGEPLPKKIKLEEASESLASRRSRRGPKPIKRILDGDEFACAMYRRLPPKKAPRKKKGKTAVTKSKRGTSKKSTESTKFDTLSCPPLKMTLIRKRYINSRNKEKYIYVIKQNPLVEVESNITVIKKSFNSENAVVEFVEDSPNDFSASSSSSTSEESVEVKPLLISADIKTMAAKDLHDDFLPSSTEKPTEEGLANNSNNDGRPIEVGTNLLQDNKNVEANIDMAAGEDSENNSKLISNTGESSNKKSMQSPNEKSNKSNELVEHQSISTFKNNKVDANINITDADKSAEGSSSNNNDKSGGIIEVGSNLSQDDEKVHANINIMIEKDSQNNGSPYFVSSTEKSSDKNMQSPNEKSCNSNKLVESQFMSVVSLKNDKVDININIINADKSVEESSSNNNNNDKGVTNVRPKSEASSSDNNNNSVRAIEAKRFLNDKKLDPNVDIMSEEDPQNRESQYFISSTGYSPDKNNMQYLNEQFYESNELVKYQTALDLSLKSKKIDVDINITDALKSVDESSINNNNNDGGIIEVESTLSLDDNKVDTNMMDIMVREDS